MFHQPLVVERSDNGLAGSRRRHHEVAVSVVHLPLDLQPIEHLGLVGVGANGQP